MEERMEDSSTSVKLYQMVEQKLSGVGETLPCTLSAMAAYSTEERGNIDYLHFMNLDNESFLEAIYMCAFNAVPPQEYLDLWREDMETLSRESFQKKFMNSFVQRVDFSSERSHLRGFDFNWDELAQAYCNLPRSYQEVLFLLLVEELTPQEAAKSLHCTVKQIYVRKSRAIKNLRDQLGGNK